jgi:pimeloyl-ACP methyl ester carboxylesterase
MPGADATAAGREPAADCFSNPAPDRYSIGSAVEPDFSVITRGFLDGLSKEGQPAGLRGGGLLLPPDYAWSREGKTRAPVALCEFVAYKTALAYEDEAEIKASIGDAPQVGFFDSSRDGLGDTQGFAFMQDGMAFVIMRGTEKGTDWTTNLQHQLTDELRTPRREKLAKELRKRHRPDMVEALLNGLAAKPGRHLGFAVGWTAVHDQILGYLEEHCPPGVPVVIGGHSLGGALALIGALELKRAGQNIAAVITFGAPQAGNETFSREYATEGLSARTVLFEAHGDSVPRLLRRWYYRLGSGLQSRFARLLTPGTEVIPRVYAVTGNPWAFLAQPALSAREVKDAVKHILDARAQRAREEEQRKAKAGSPERATDAAEKPATSAAPTNPAPTPTSTPPIQGPGATRPPQETQSAGAPAWWVVGAIVVMVLLLTLWLLVRSKRSAHAIIERYALFLSTLSYQHIRALRAGEPLPAADRLSLANDDLSRYLRFIRGEGSYVDKARAADLPVRLDPDLDLATFLSEPKNII